MSAQLSLQSPILVVGGVASAATTGALIAFGHRLGNAGLPFAAVSAVVLHRTPSAGAAGLVLAGIVLHVVATFAWSIVFLWLAARLHRRESIAAGLVATAEFVISWIVAWSAGSGLSSVLPLGDRLVFALVLGGALVVGMRFAIPALQKA